MKTWLTEKLKIKLPIILAPMFLVSNKEMISQAIRSGIAACIPAQNFRTPKELKEVLTAIKEETPGAFGVNLIVNKSNIKLEEQLEACLEVGPAFIITSLGNPKEVIERAHQKGILVFCDVTDLDYAKKVESLGADALIAVNSGAGGHAGQIPITVLVPLLVKECSIPVISAGGVATGSGVLSVLSLGAAGLSMGSPFIATRESPVSEDYKQAIIDYGAADIALTTKISGSPLTVIKTPYVKKIGLKQNPIERFLNQNKNPKLWGHENDPERVTRIEPSVRFKSSAKPNSIFSLTRR